jgi:hypothetical protein
MTDQTTPLPPEEAPWRAGLHSARATALPGAVLVGAAIGVVVSYYHVPAVHAALEQLAAIRVRGGFFYSAASTALFAGIIPFLYLHFTPTTRAGHPWPHLAFFALFWGYKGIEVDGLYRLQALMFGTGVDFGTIFKKLLFDQIVYNGMFAAPYGVLVYAWKDAGFKWGPVLADFRAPRWYYRRVFSVMIAVMGVWIPAVCCIYSMPPALQIPLNSLVNCFWVILFSLIMARQNSGDTRG